MSSMKRGARLVHTFTLSLIRASALLAMACWGCDPAGPESQFWIEGPSVVRPTIARPDAAALFCALPFKLHGNRSPVSSIAHVASWEVAGIGTRFESVEPDSAIRAMVESGRVVSPIARSSPFTLVTSMRTETGERAEHYWVCG
jgi:hypothetical protein